MAKVPLDDDTWAPLVRSDLNTALLDGELVIFDPLTAELHQLDPLGTIIWPFLDGTATLGELVEDLAAVFEVAVSQVRTDVSGLLGLLEEHKLLEGTQPDEIEPPVETESAGPTYLVDPPAP